MASRIPLVAASAACLVIGFAAGWSLHRAPAAAPATPAAEAPATAAQPEDERVATLRWLKAAGLPLQISPLSFSDLMLNPIFVRAYALDGGEEAKLRLALDAAQRDYAAVLATAARGEVSADGRQVTVTIQPSPEEGGRIHDRLLAAFKHVLGPGRFALFNELSLASFERSFDGFGAAEVVLTMNLQPRIVGDGVKTYAITRSVSAPGAVRSSSNSQIDLATARRNFPVIFRFLPADFGAEPAEAK